MSVLDALGTGRANAMRKIDLARRLGIPTRHVEKEIEQLRKSGKAGICSDSEVGYWLPETLQELEENVDRRRRRAIVQFITVKGEKEFARRWRDELHPKPAEPEPAPQPAQESLWA